MQFPSLIITALLSTLALALPRQEAARRGIVSAVSMAAANEEWTIVKFTRACDQPDTLCTYTFGVNRNDGGAVVPCTYQAKGEHASQLAVNGAACGQYSVSSSWSGQFGADNGFTTLAVVDFAGNKLVYPGYTDKQLVNNATVGPDQSYPVQAIKR